MRRMIHRISSAFIGLVVLQLAPGDLTNAGGRTPNGATTIGLKPGFALGSDWDDEVAGVESLVPYARAMMLVRAQTDAEAKAFPPPEGQQRLLVREVIKGFVADQHLTRPAGVLKPGQAAIVLLRYEYEARNQWDDLPPEPHSDVKGLPPRKWGALPEAKPLVWLIWPLEGDSFQTGDVRGADSGEPVTLKYLRDMAVSGSPEEVDLYPQILDAILFPEKVNALAHKDPDRAVYVRFAAAVRDLDRDVPSLALLLEERDRTVRAAAEKRLLALTGADVARPSAETPAGRHAWSEAWRKWWTEHKDARVWDEAKTRWAIATEGRPSPSRWPAVPESLKQPADGFPPELVKAVEKQDAAAFARAFRAWMDSGVLRDRQIRYAMTLPGDVPRDRLPTDVLLSDRRSTDERMKAVALFAALWHRDRFFAEHARTMGRLEAESPDGEMVCRAAFWEPRSFLLSATAESLLGKVKDAASRRLLLHLFTEDAMDDAILDGARARIQSGDKQFTGDLVEYVKENRGSAAQWAGRLLCQEHQAAVVPLQVEWLKDASEDLRASAAFNLCWLPSAGAVPGLLDALKVEKVPRVREQLLRAIAQTGDKRGLDVLLTAATDDKDETTLCEVARGLARIGDKRALPALADLASRGDREAVNSFGYVSGLYKGYAPDRFWSYPGRSAEEVAAGMAVIEKWRAVQKQPK